MSVQVSDADIVVEPGPVNLLRLRRLLNALSLQENAGSQTLTRRSIVSVSTSFGRLDCMLERGRQEWARLRENASYVEVAGVPVLVASLADAEALRATYKQG